MGIEPWSERLCKSSKLVTLTVLNSNHKVKIGFYQYVTIGLHKWVNIAIQMYRFHPS